jgi:hypothetical protein
MTSHSARTRSGLAAAKTYGPQLGGRRVSAERWAEISLEARLGRSRSAERRAALEVLPAIESAKAAGAMRFFTRFRIRNRVRDSGRPRERPGRRPGSLIPG